MCAGGNDDFPTLFVSTIVVAILRMSLMQADALNHPPLVRCTEVDELGEVGMLRDLVRQESGDARGGGEGGGGGGLDIAIVLP